MRNNKLLLTTVSIVTVMILLLVPTYLYVVDAPLSIFKAVSLSATAFAILLIVFAIWLLYKKEWRRILGLTAKGVTTRVILKAIAIGLLINIIRNISMLFIDLFVLGKVPTSPLGISANALQMFIATLIIAPLFEEFLFRGFIQGLWQKLYSNKEKMPAKLIITVTALLFAISHFGFLHNISLKEFLFAAFGTFISAIYFSWLRYKYNSIIPSIFAHTGGNVAGSIVMPLLIVIMTSVSGFPGNKLSDLRWKAEIAKYEHDTLPYNFDPNNMCEWERSYTKYTTLERPRSKEIIKHLKRENIEIDVYFTIDTCGKIYNLHLTDTIWISTDWHKEGRKYAPQSYYVNEYGYDFPAEAFKFVQSMPQCKPYIVDGKKVEKEMKVLVPLHY